MANVNWKQASSGNWAIGANWSGGVAPTSAGDATINIFGNYIVTIDSAVSANSLTFDAPGAELLETAAGSLSLGGALTVNNGFIQLGQANSINGGVTLNGGEVAVGFTGALGSGTLALAGGELLGTVNETIGNALDLNRNLTIAAAHGTTLDIGSGGWTLESGATLNFGAAGQDGTVVWHTPVDVVIRTPGDQTVHVRGGVLQAGQGPQDTGLNFLLSTISGTTVDAGASIDINGFDTGIDALSGAGTVTNSGADFKLLTLQGAASIFSGTIGGKLSIDVKNSIELTGNSTYTGSAHIESGGVLTLGDGGTSGSIPVGSGSSITVNGVLAFDRSNAMTVSATLFGSGDIEQEGSGTTTLAGLNSFVGTFDITAGTLAAAAYALSTASVTLNGGELLATGDETLSGALTLDGNSTIAAAHGKTFHAGSGGWTLDTGATLNFGAAGEDGTVVWDQEPGGGGTIVDNFTQTVNVQDGTLKSGGGFLFSYLLSNVTQTLVQAGAAIDTAGFDTTISGLGGAGTVTDSSGSAVLTLTNAPLQFSGVLAGGLNLDIQSDVTLTGDNTFAGTTLIEAGFTLQLGDGGVTGSIPGGGQTITNNGTLVIDRSNAYTLDNAISGSGALTQKGTGTTTIDTAIGFTGPVDIASGTLAIGNENALVGLGSNINLSGGELLGTVDESIAKPLNINSSIIAAAHGTMLDIGSAGYTVNANAALEFGAAGQDGTIVWHSPNNSTVYASGTTVRVQFGTLTQTDGSLSFLLGSTSGTTVDATIDLAGFDTSITNLKGAGTITNTGAMTTLNIAGCLFQGTLSGALGLQVSSGADFSGMSTISGGISIVNDAVINEGTFDLTSDSGVTGNLNDNAAVTNEGVFEKTAGSGTATISTPFENDGTLGVTSGSLQFTGGFNNIGIVLGVLSYSGGTWTVTANAPGQFSYFGGSGDNNFVIGATAPIFIDGGAGNDTVELRANVTLHPGSLANVETVHVDSGVTANLSALTTGENIVLSSVANGSASVIGTQGNDTIVGGAGSDTIDGGKGADTLTGGAGADIFVFKPSDGADTITDFTAAGAVHDRVDLRAMPNLNSFTQLLADATQVGADTVLDFGNGDTLTLQGVTKTSLTASDFIINPPPSDFNADGNSDLLWQNTDGHVSIWEMNGTSVTDRTTLGTNPGPSWHVIGTGDFNADGFSDLLWQNTNGAVSIWEMDGTSVLHNPTLPDNLGPSWHAIGTGDFNGDGKSDILWQNTNGAVSIWEMDGTNVLSKQTLSVNPGPSWHVIGTGDFNGDGKSDILWQNTNGAVSIWEMNGTSVITNPTLKTNPGPSWHVIDAGDFNDDGFSDILWQNTNGAVSIWEMNGANVVTNPTLHTNPGSAWHVINVADYNGDGHADITWQNNNGAASIWEMDGTNVLTNPTLTPNPGSAWHVVGPHNGITT